MYPLVSLAALLLLTPSVVAAIGRNGRAHGNIAPPPLMPLFDREDSAGSRTSPVVSRNGTVLPPYDTTYYFDQLVDHTNPGLGTFKQRYWHTYEYYEPGGPILLLTPGESNADGYADVFLTNQGIFGAIAEKINGSVVLIEHRYYGLSNPVPDLSTKNMKYHTIQQAIDDFEYFAKNVHLPMPNGDHLAPGKAPWVLLGGSYSGALVSFTMVNKPGLFHAGYGSSAVVESITDFWQYFEPVRQNMPQNCSADVQAVVAYIDKVFASGNQSGINHIKGVFGLSALTHLDDVAGALRNNLWDWQSLQPTSGPGAVFYQFCDALEVKDGVNAGPSGWGVDHALPAWGKFWTDAYIADFCGDRDIETCFGTYDKNAIMFTNTSIDQETRSWTWIVCNEMGFIQDAAPANHPSLISRLVTTAYDLQICQNYFPEAFSPQHPAVPAVTKTNQAYNGWNVQVDRLFFANGQRDPWKDATLSAEGQDFHSTPTQPIAISDGFHCSDLRMSNGLADPSVKAVQDQAISSMVRWMGEWKPASA